MVWQTGCLQEEEVGRSQKYSLMIGVKSKLGG